MTILLITLVVSFTVISGFFSLAQIGLFSLPSIEVKLYKKDRNPRKRLIAELLSKPRDLLVTILMCDIAVNILVQNFAAKLFGDGSSWWLKVGVPLGLTLILGEVVPKTIALPNNSAIAYALAPSINIITRSLGPIRAITNAITYQLSRLLFFFLRKEDDISKEELHHVLKTSKSRGILNQEEAELVDGYLSLTDFIVKERMRPRHEIRYYDVDEPLSKLLHLFADQEFSRVPVCHGELQNMLGIISAKTFFIHLPTIKEPKDLLPLLRKPFYVPETILARSLLKQLLFTDQTLGIVVDEYGSISGLISQEDLFEVVIGEITDKRDVKTRFTPAGKDIIITSGKFELSEFEELFGVALPSENNVVTIGGWLTEQLGDIPKSGDKFTWQDFLFQVLSADPHRVRRVYIRRMHKGVESK